MAKLSELARGLIRFGTRRLAVKRERAVAFASARMRLGDPGWMFVLSDTRVHRFVRPPGLGYGQALCGAEVPTGAMAVPIHQWLTILTNNEKERVCICNACALIDYDKPDPSSDTPRQRRR